MLLLVLLIIFVVLIILLRNCCKKSSYTRPYSGRDFAYNDDFDTLNSYHETDKKNTSDDPKLYVGLPPGDNMIYFEDDGDSYL